MSYPILPPIITISSVTPNSITISISSYGQNQNTLGSNLRLFKNNNPSVFGTAVFAAIQKPQSTFTFTGLNPYTIYFFGAANNISQFSNIVSATTIAPSPTPTVTISRTPKTTPTPTQTVTKTVTPTPTLTRTVTPTPTLTRTVTPTPTITGTPSLSGAPSPTGTPRATPTITGTPVPSAT
jgi:hypothetical protein